MTWRIHEKEIRNLISMSGQERYDYFVRKVADWEEVWSLKAPSGWCIFGEVNERQCFPVWPHARYAEQHIYGMFSDAKAEIIELKPFLDRWLPGMLKDGTYIAVFPNAESRGVVVNPSQLLEDLKAECDQYE